MNASDVTIVTVAYNSQTVLPAMLDSVPAGVPVIVVDNASDDAGELAQIAQAAGARLIRNDVNEGFGRACNRGAAVAATDWLLFLNPDAQLGAGALDAFLSCASAHPHASAFNPRFLDGQGRMRFKRRSKIAPAAATTSVPEADAEIATLHGSAIFVARDTFGAVGGFDPAIFLYHEDDDLALRLAERGPIMLCHGATVTHLEGRSSARTSRTAYFKAYHMARSRTYAYAKHGHSMAGLRTLGRGVMQMLSPANLFLARKRAKHWGFLRGALSALQDGGQTPPAPPLGSGNRA